MLGRLGLVCMAAAVGSGCTTQPLSTHKMAGPLVMDMWAPQDEATNVQDWHRMARKIVDEAQYVGLLSPGNMIYVSADQSTPFVRELARAVRTDIIHRGGAVAASPSRAAVLKLDADIVVWGSRATDDPYRNRAEGIWHATVTSGDRVVMAVQEPFYVYASDLNHYARMEPLSDPSLDLARSAQPIRYSR